jgi:hypothetical protein
MIKGPSIDEIIRKMVLAHADNEVMGLALVFVNEKLETEIEMSFGNGQAYAMNTGVDLLKQAILARIMNAGRIEPRERE